ncbi:MAG: hypothetical protein KDD38_03750 [Bdellovibrionales bacterium]|nr:hypothetical protein [Bdellovibrionales bacterium]
MTKILSFKNLSRFFAALISILLLSSVASADIQYVRWEEKNTLSDDLSSILPKLNIEKGLELKEQDFVEVEARPLAHSHFRTYVQVEEGIPLDGALIRAWTSPLTGTLIQMEAHIDDSSLKNARESILALNKIAKNKLKAHMSSLNNMSYVREVVLNHRDDQRIGKIKFEDKWVNTDLVREIEVTGRRGTHTIKVSHFTKEIIESTYKEFPQADVPALVYPIYEEAEKTKARQTRIPVLLKNLLDTRKETTTDPYLPLKSRRYYEDKMDPVLGETPEGQAQGYWSPNWLLQTAMALYDALPMAPNNFSNGGMYLVGKYASINIHPDAVANTKGLNFTPTFSSQLAILWKQNIIGNSQRWELVPSGAYYGRPLTSEIDASTREARRLPDHDPVSYINDGFDEVQVYYAIDRLMESLHGMGFTDPELSTRAFHAFLYDPDISMRDNAYYTNDTINFTTYSPDNMNFARDNSTIWHELGHGVMDRLMGDLIELADTGGLAEGMADFVAQLVIQDVTGGAPFDGSEDFRIINRTGFNLTNESHDDGEAYGGAMNDMLTGAIQKFGRIGVAKMSDLTLEAMRLTRNHPALTANDWFEHMLYADKLGRAGVRAPLEMHDLIVNALNTRNFRLDRGPIAKFTVKNAGRELTDSGAGSRGRPIPHTLAEGDVAKHDLEISLTSSEFYQFQYPVRVEVGLNGGPLQGAVNWANEDQAPFQYTLNSAADKLKIHLEALPGCEFINREDGSCSDFAYLQIYNNGETRPVAKKRFYLRISEGKKLTEKEKPLAAQ